MRFNWKIAAGAVFVLALIMLAIPQTDREGREGKPKISSAGEMQYKRQLLEQDVLRTEELCRRECRLDMQKVIREWSASDEREGDAMHLQAMQQEHPHMRYLEATRGKHTFTQGELSDLPEEILPYVELARERVKANRTYESPRISTDEGPYFVAAIQAESAGEDHSGYVLAAVKQQILEQIQSEQRKNLRLVPYPSDARFGIQSADSDTLHKVDVDHPEENEDISHYYVNDIVVRFTDELSDEVLSRIRRDIDASSVQHAGYAYIFRSNTLTYEQMLTYFRDHHSTRYIEPHYMYVTNEQPNDALYADYQWNLPATRTESGWQMAEQGEEVIVAVIDTGVDLNHPDLKNRLVEGYNVYTEGSDANDDVGHGTHVAGIIAAEINNYEGIAGMAPNTRIMPVKVLDSSGAGSTYAVAQGIIWAADHGAKVINLSLGNYAEAQFLHDAIRYAYDRDVVLVAATGNDHTESPGYPAAYEEVIAVGATDSNGQIAQFSNYGAYVDVAAPGVSIASTYPGNQYAALSGTSMASPHAAALAAMIRSVNPSLSNKQVMDLLRSTSTDLGEAGHDVYYGYGQIDVTRALSAARSDGQSALNWGDSLLRRLERIIQKYRP
jgi:type VII secretion-associated serine protease mycosin